MALSEAWQFLTVFQKFCLPEGGWEADPVLQQEWGNKSVLHISSGESCKPRCLHLVVVTHMILGYSGSRLSYCLFTDSLCKSSVQEKTSPVLGINCLTASQCFKAHCGKRLPFPATSHLEIATDPWSFWSRELPILSLHLFIHDWFYTNFFIFKGCNLAHPAVHFRRVFFQSRASKKTFIFFHKTCSMYKNHLSSHSLTYSSLNCCFLERVPKQPHLWYLTIHYMEFFI